MYQTLWITTALHQGTCNLIHVMLAVAFHTMEICSQTFGKKVFLNIAIKLVLGRWPLSWAGANLL